MEVKSENQTSYIMCVERLPLSAYHFRENGMRGGGVICKEEHWGKWLSTGLLAVGSLGIWNH